MVLFREHSTQFKGLYEFDPLAETLTRIFGSGPRLIAHDMVVRFFKYAHAHDHALTLRSVTLIASPFTHCAHERLVLPIPQNHIYLYRYTCTSVLYSYCTRTTLVQYSVQCTVYTVQYSSRPLVHGSFVYICISKLEVIVRCEPACECEQIQQRVQVLVGGAHYEAPEHSNRRDRAAAQHVGR